MVLNHAEARVVDLVNLVYEVPGMPVAVFDGECQLRADEAWFSCCLTHVAPPRAPSQLIQLRRAPACAVSVTYREVFPQQAAPSPFYEITSRLDRLIALLERRGPA